MSAQPLTASQVRQKYLDFFAARAHEVVARTNLVPQNDASTLFTNSGMQPMLPYLLGEPYPKGLTRIVDSQTCLRSDDIEEVGDNRHTTFFEMLGNWSFGDYFKAEQIPWMWEFLTKEIGLDQDRFYVTCYGGHEEYGIPKDVESADIWKGIFANEGLSHGEADMVSEEGGARRGMKDGERIFYFNGKKNWWSRGGDEDGTPIGDPCGPDSEMFYLFPDIEHDTAYGENCHPNCDCGRFIELGNNVFMQYKKADDGVFEKLPANNVDHGAGLERVAAAALNTDDMFQISLLRPIINTLEEESGFDYEDKKISMRIIADHARGAMWLLTDGVLPSNTAQGYVLRRLIRRSIRAAHSLGIETGLATLIAPVVVAAYKDDFPEVLENEKLIVEEFEREERLFRRTLDKGLREFAKLSSDGSLSSADIFKLYDTYGFPKEMSLEEAENNEVKVDAAWENDFQKLLDQQKQRSRTAAKGQFKGGLAGQSEQHTKYHTATHVMYKALRMVLGEHVEQRGSNITEERLRFDFNHPERMTDEQKQQVENIVNKVITDDLPVKWVEMPTDEALASGARGHFGEKYGETSKVYIIGPEDNPYSMELCGGPHVENTGFMAEPDNEDGSKKRFKILKEQSSSAGIRRIKAVIR